MAPHVSSQALGNGTRHEMLWRARGKSACQGGLHPRPGSGCLLALPSAGVGTVLFREGFAYASVSAFAIPPFAFDEVPALRKRALDGGS